jgi:hypothetical protein
MTAKKGRGLLLVYADVAEEHEEEFNRWYDEEHIPERLSIPGVLDAARYVAVRGGPKYLACYEIDQAGTYFSDAWQQHLDRPTPWSRRMSPTVIGRNVVRNLYTLLYPITLPDDVAQTPLAPALLIGRMSVPTELEIAFNTAYHNERLPLYRSIPGYWHARRFSVVAGEPKYVTVHECEAPEVAESPEWQAVRATVTPKWSEVSPHITFAPGAPGVYKRILPAA